MRLPISWNKSWRSKNIVVLLALALTSVLGSIPARAFTCDDVRGLSTAEQDYWSKQLMLSSMQRRLIYVACYQNYRARTQEIVRR